MKYSNVQELYTRRMDEYAAFASFFQARQGLQRLLETSAPLQARMTVLDAGCGFGMATFALLDALRRKKLDYERIDAFDLTPAMLSHFQDELDSHEITRVKLTQADVLALDTLPSLWSDYDFILSTSMLEHLPRHALPRALSALRARLAPEGHILLMITRRTLETKLLIEWLWHANRYTSSELRSACAEARLEIVRFLRFPIRYMWLNRANYVMLARASSQPH